MSINTKDRVPYVIRPYKVGDDVREAKRLNEHIEATNRLSRGIAPAREIVSEGSRKQAETRLMKIQTFEPDGANPGAGIEGWIMCIAGLTTYRVAVPPVFRYPLWNGKTINGVTYVADPTNWQRRTATRGSDTENQVITPAYSALDGGLDMIFAMAGFIGGVDLKYKLNPPIQDPNDPDEVIKEQDIDWQDMTPGRVWAEESD